MIGLYTLCSLQGALNLSWQRGKFTISFDNPYKINMK